VSDVLELDLFENGEWILAFDGRVLEIFGRIHPNWNVNNLVDVDSWRIHVRQLDVKVTGPDKKGYHEIAFCSHADPSGAFKVAKLDESRLSRLQPFLEALATASGAVATGSTSDPLLAAKGRAFQAVTAEHDIHLGSQPEDVRRAVVSDLQAAGVSIDPDSLMMRFTDLAQFDAALEIYKRHGLLPADASIS
jgi:hypothetical protein